MSMYVEIKVLQKSNFLQHMINSDIFYSIPFHFLKMLVLWTKFISKYVGIYTSKKYFIVSLNFRTALIFRQTFP